MDRLPTRTLGRGLEVSAIGFGCMGMTMSYGPSPIDIGGHNMGRSEKWGDIGREPRVAFVVDDVLPPWRPRSIEIRGAANRVSSGGTGLGRGFSDEFVRIAPTRIVSWGIGATGRPPDLRVPGRDVANAPKALQ